MAATRKLTAAAHGSGVGGTQARFALACVPVTAILFLASMFVAITLVVLMILKRVGHLRLWPAVLLIVCAPLEVYRTETGMFNLSVFRLALAVGAASLIWRLVKRPPRRIAVPAVIAVYGALIIVQTLSVLLVTETPALGTKFVLQYVGGLAAVVVVLSVVRRRDLPTVALTYVCSAVLPAIASVWRVLWPVDGNAPHTLPGLDLLPIDPVLAATRRDGSFLLEGIQRLQGTHADPNHFAFFLATVLVATLGLMIQRWHAGFAPGDARSRQLCLAAAIVTVLLIGTYSRSGWLLASIGIALLAALIGRTALRTLLTRRHIAVALVLCTACAAVAAPAVLTRLNPSTTGSSISTSQHLDTMRIAIDLLVEHPVTGTGLGGYGRFAGQPELISSSHSTILTTAAELGAPGALLLLAVFGATGVWGRRTIAGVRDPGDRALRASLLGAWLAMALANLLYEVWLDDFQWILFALVLVGMRQPSLQLAPWPIHRLRASRAPA